jgi:hypothetical protein
MIRLSDPYHRAPAHTLQIGDYVPLQRLATGELFEKMILHVERRHRAVVVRYLGGTEHVLKTADRVYRRDGLTLERCRHAPYYGEWVLRREGSPFGSAPGWLTQTEANERLRAAYVVVMQGRR